jgi:hypothetical protein
MRGMKPKLFYLTLFNGLLVTLSQQAIIIANPVSCENYPTPSEKAVQCIENIAQEITVKISGNRGETKTSASGVMIAKKKVSDSKKSDYLYLVLTNDHPIRGLDSIEIETFDQKIYQAFVLKNANQKLINNKLDLALIWFASPENYNIATLNDSNSTQSVRVNQNYQKMYVSGFPCQQKADQQGKTCQFEFNKTFGVWWDSPLNEGYQIGYPINAISGISGGSVLNDQGKLIGIQGKGNLLQPATSGYRYETIPKLSDESKRFMNYFSIAIPITRYQTLFPTSHVNLFEEAQNYYEQQKPQSPKQRSSKDDYSWFNRLKQSLTIPKITLFAAILVFLYFNLIFICSIIYFSRRLKRITEIVQKTQKSSHQNRTNDQNSSS